MNAAEYLQGLAAKGNLRTLPGIDRSCDYLDFSSNDYLGLAADPTLLERFLDETPREKILFTSSASRLLAACQEQYHLLEFELEMLYDKPALLFNSGYHANTGLIPALCDKSTLILADKLVHASIIDGIKLSGCEFQRFRHNDVAHLRRLIERHRPSGDNILVIIESVYSMDGDAVNLYQYTALKEEYPGIMLYVDEAHALGVMGPRGLGNSAYGDRIEHIDVIIGTLGKAAASMGAFAILDDELKQLAINRSRSLIFSTALPPVNIAWSSFMLKTITKADDRRRKLRDLEGQLAQGLKNITGAPHVPSHIQPYIVGDPRVAVELSHKLAQEGIKVLPIRTPTVPPGTERLRISLSAAMTAHDVMRLIKALSHYRQ